MINIRDYIRPKFSDFTIKLEHKLLCHLQDEFGAELENYIYSTFYNSFQAKVGDVIEDDLRVQIKYIRT